MSLFGVSQVFLPVGQKCWGPSLPEVDVGPGENVVDRPTYRNSPQFTFRHGRRAGRLSFLTANTDRPVVGVQSRCLSVHLHHVSSDPVLPDVGLSDSYLESLTYISRLETLTGDSVFGPKLYYNVTRVGTLNGTSVSLG